MKRRKSIFGRLEYGNVIDQIGSILVVIFIFALILAYSAYGKLTQERLAVDNVAKEYLYKMEEYGYLRSEDEDAMVLAMNQVGATVVSFGETTREKESSSDAQVTYGDQVVLDLTLSYPNPLFNVFSRDNSWIKIFGFDEEISYHIRMSATAKW